MWQANRAEAIGTARIVTAEPEAPYPIRPRTYREQAKAAQFAFARPQIR